MADEKSFLRRRWKLLLNIITLVAVGAMVIAIRHDLADTFENLGRINTYALLFLLPIQALNYHAQVKLYQGMFSIVGNELPYKGLYRAALELNFVNHVFPSGGAAGISYFGLRLKSAQITAAKATLIQIMKLALTILSFEVLLLIGMVVLSAFGKANNLTVMVGTAITVLLIVGTAVFVYIGESRSRINHLFTAVARFLNRLIRLVRPGHPETIKIDKAREVFDDFHDNYKLLRSSLPQLKAPFWWAMLCNVTEIASVYVVFVAFGHFINVGAVILAYGVANFAGLVSVLPGGVGIYEFLMLAVLAAAGVPAGVAIPAVIMYRVLNTLIQVPPGYVLYQQNLNASKSKPGL